MDTPFCFDCRFFMPENRLHNDLTEDQWDECLDGECHRNCPSLGMMLVDRHGDKDRAFGEWPKVLAGDWCDRFQARQVDRGNRAVQAFLLTEQGAAAADAAEGRSVRIDPEPSRPASEADWRAWARRVADDGQVGPMRAVALCGDMTAAGKPGSPLAPRVP